MQRTFLQIACSLLLPVSMIQAQGLKIEAGAYFKATGAVSIVSESGSIINNGNGDLSTADIYFKGTGNIVFGGTGVLSVQNLVNARAKGKTILQNDLAVNGQVTLQTGILDMNGHNIHLSATGSLSNESETGRIMDALGGQITITVKLNAPLAANPGNLGAIITSPSNLGNVVIKRGQQSQTTGNPGGSILRYYDITPTNNTALGAILRFSYLDAELNGLAEKDLSLYRSTDDGASWTSEGFSGRSASSDYVDLSGVNSFSRWTLSSSGALLPVLLTDFNTQCDGSSVGLSWKTAQEVNSKRFIIEKSVTGADWKVIGTVAAHGNTVAESAYSYKDASPAVAKTYYRLQEEDLDGRTVYSPVRVVDPCSANGVQLKLSPVPVYRTGNLFLQAATGGRSLITISNAAGKQVYQQSIQLNKGNNQVTLDLGVLTAGYYYLSVDMPETGRKGISFVKQ